LGYFRRLRGGSPQRAGDSPPASENELMRGVYLQQLFTHSMKLAVLEPVRSAMVWP